MRMNGNRMAVVLLIRSLSSLQMYAEGLSTCSTLGTDMTKHLELVIGSLSPQPEEGTSAHRVQRILEAIGVDSVVSY